MRSVWLAAVVLVATAIVISGAPSEAAVIRVNGTGGNNANSGSDWSLAKATIAGAIASAVAGDEVWVAAGTYGIVTLKEGVSLYGGFVGTETGRDQRAPSLNFTTIDNAGTAGKSVVTGGAGITRATVIDGFTIKGGKGVPRNMMQMRYAYEGGGFMLKGTAASYCSPTISNNTITQNYNTTGTSGMTKYFYGGGIYGIYSSPLVTKNTITDNRSDYGLAMYFTGASSPVIAGNTISANTHATGATTLYIATAHNSGAASSVITGNNITGNNLGVLTGSAIYCGSELGALTVKIANNLIRGNGGSGIALAQLSSANTLDGTVANNVIAGNTSSAIGGGISLAGATVAILNNTIVGNTATANGGGIGFSSNAYGTSAPAIINNIVAFNSSGVMGPADGAVLRDNDVYGNTLYNHSGVAAGTTDFSIEPALADYAGGNYRLSSESPCADTGDDTVVSSYALPSPPGWVDMDGQIRPLGARIDVGAYEIAASDATAPTIGLVVAAPAMVAAGDSVHVSVNVTDDTSVVSVKANGVALQHGAGSLWEGDIIADAAVGTHPVAVVASDSVGNPASSNAHYRTARVFAASAKCTCDAVMCNASGNFLFALWGKVTTDGANQFMLDDGSGRTVRVVAPGYALSNGDYARARGVLDTTTSPVTLNCLAAHVQLLAGEGGGGTEPGLFRDPQEAVNISTTPGVVEINLEAKIAPISVNGTTANLMTYNGQFPGPTVRISKGDTLKVHLLNSLPATSETNILGFTKNLTNLHVHGMHVSPEPPGDYVMYALESGQTYNHEYDARHQVGGVLNFYHPHKHGVVAEQFWAGLVGPLVVKDETPVLEPYETHIMVLKDISLAGDQPAPHSTMMDYMNGKEGDVLMVNGQVNPKLYVKNGQIQRWRLLNASNARFYKLSLENHPLYVVGTDGGLLDKPYQVSEILLSPGERVDLLIKFSSGTGDFRLRALPYSRMSMGMGGGGMGGGTAMDLLTASYRSSVSPAQELPVSVNPSAVRMNPDSLMIAARRTLTLSMMMGRGYINMMDYDVDPYMMMSSVGTYEIWTIENNSNMDHPLHQHVDAAQVLSVTGGDAGYSSLYTSVPAMKDVVIVPRMGSVQILVPITDWTGMAMFHCHILEHEDIGMMGHWHIMDGDMPM